MKLKRITAVLMAGVMTFGMAACGGTSGGTSQNASGGNGGAGGQSAGDKTITVWAWDEAFNIKALEVAKEMYAGINPDVTINIVNMAQADTVAKLNTSLSSGTYEGLPDIVLIEDYRIQGYLNPYEAEFADLSDIAKPEDFAAYKTAVNQKNGKLYGIPFDSGVAGTFYRTDYIEAAGYTAADMENLTWEKYIEIGKAVKEKTGKFMCTLDPSELWQIRMMMQSAGVWYTGEDGSVTINNNQALKDALEIYMALVDSGAVKMVSGWDAVVGAFNSGDVASVIAGCWMSPSVLQAEDQSGKWAIAQCPRMGANADSVNASSLGGAGFYVLKNVGHEEIAKDFLKNTFASSVDLMDKLAVDINLVSTVKAAAEAPNYSKGLEFYGGQEIFGDFLNWTNQVPMVNYGQNTYQIEALMTEVVQAIINGADMQEILDQYQTQIEASVGQ